MGRQSVTLVAVAVVAGGLGFGAATATAADTATLRLSLYAAQDFWGERPCSPQVIVKRPPDGDAYADASTCTLLLAPKVMRGPRQLLCALIFHEYGHLLGRGHSGAPRSIMRPGVGFLPEVCARWWLSRRTYRVVRRVGFATR